MHVKNLHFINPTIIFAKLKQFVVIRNLILLCKNYHYNFWNLSFSFSFCKRTNTTFWC